MNTNSDKEELDAAEISRRRDAALLRALSTPHKKQADMKLGKQKRGLLTKRQRAPTDRKSDDDKSGF